MKVIRVSFAIDNPGALSPDAARLLAYVEKDSRLVFGEFLPGKASAARHIATDAVLAIESRLAPAAVDSTISRAPLLSSRARGAPHVQSRGGADDVIVDFVHDDRLIETAAQRGARLWRLTSHYPYAGMPEISQRAPTHTIRLLEFDNATHRWRVIDQAQYNPKALASRHQSYTREKSLLLILRALQVLKSGKLITLDDFDAAPFQPTLSLTASYVGKAIGGAADRLRRRFLEKTGRRPNMWILKAGQGDPFTADLNDAIDLAPSDNRFWADPFLFEHDGVLYIFFEDYNYETEKGIISVGKLNGRHFEFLGPVLMQDYHLSFPFIFRDGDDVFMLPETNEANRIEIWRATAFPHRWELHSTALDGVHAADSVIAKIDGAYWLFTNQSCDASGDLCTELYLYRIDGPDMNSIEPHPLNPVVIDCASARNGGRVFQRDGEWFRTAQENTHGVYGFGLKLMRIEMLSMDAYRETEFCRLTPEAVQGARAIHHFDQHRGLFVIDACLESGGKAQR